MPEPLLEVRHVSKTFPGVRALREVSLTVGSGEIVALVGHNGSGKSTLVKLLAGIHHPDDGGSIMVHEGAGEPPLSGADARRRLHFIHQDLGLIEQLSAVENLDLGRPLGARGLKPSPTRRERTRAIEVIAQFGASFDVEVPIATLTPAERAIVAIARALDGWTSARNVLVLDEPTSALHGDESEKLYEAVRRVAAKGAGVIFISHRLDEVVALADRAVVLRDGRLVADEPRGSFDHDTLVEHIAGGEIAVAHRSHAAVANDARLQAAGLAGPGIASVDLEVRAGEIVGITGLVGSGREHLAGILFGLHPRTAGTVSVDGRRVPPSDPAAAIAAGVGFVPADRRRKGAIMTMNARENLTLPRLGPLCRHAGLVRAAEDREARRWMDYVDVLPAAPERPLALFSGGNQQKVVLAKWLRIDPVVLILDEPTQSVDVGAKAAIYDLILGAAAAGAAVLVSSSDTKELADLCRRVLVLREGRVAAEIKTRDLTEARLVRETLGRQTATVLTSPSYQGDG